MIIKSFVVEEQTEEEANGIMTRTVSYGTLTAIMQLIGQIQAPFTNISGYLPKYSENGR